jgi:hypothetical protein
MARCLISKFFLTFDIFMFTFLESRDSSIGIATGWTTGVIFLAGTIDFSLLHRVQADPGAHPASYTMGTGGFSLRVNHPGREANDAKNREAISPLCNTTS